MKTTQQKRATRHSLAGRSLTRRGGFTLIELMMVLAIAAVVVALTTTGYHEIQRGHRRVTCQTNMTQLYQAARMYAADEGGLFPYFEQRNCVTDDHTGIGLWALYTFPRATNPDQLPLVGDMPAERYIRNSAVLHCPAVHDNDELYVNGGVNYNPAYASYMACDDFDGTGPISPVPIYEAWRTVFPTDPDWRRQLWHYNGAPSSTNYPVNMPPASDTVVFWCPNHRLQRDFDNVMFYDGSAQLIKREQITAGGSRYGYQRVPIDEVND